jgi:hypothetical protein
MTSLEISMRWERESGRRGECAFFSRGQCPNLYFDRDRLITACGSGLVIDFRAKSNPKE